MKSKKSSFRGKTTSNASKRKQGRGIDYLSLPAGVELFKPEKDEKYVLDFMPYKVTDKNHPDKDAKNDIATVGSYWYKRPIKIHDQIGANHEKAICLRSIGKPCPICDYRDELKKNDGDEAIIKSLYSKDRNVYVVRLPKSKDKKERLITYFFDFSDYLFQEKFESQLADKEQFDTFPDHMEGCSIAVAFGEGPFKNPDPTRFDFEARTNQYTDEDLDEVPELDECFNILTYAELKAKFFESGEEEEDEVEDKKPKKSASKKVLEPEEDEDDEEEEEEKKPVAKKAKKIVEPEPEEDDEEEEDEDEESLTDQINSLNKVSALMELAEECGNFDKKELKMLAAIKKASELKAKMIEMITPDEDEEEEEEEEDEIESLTDQINACKKVSELMAIAESNDQMNSKKTLKQLSDIKKVSELKSAMLEYTDLPFNTGDKTSPKKDEGTCPSGYKFGVETDEYDECEDCPIWQKCYDKQQGKK